MSANPPADGMFFVDQPPPAEPVDTSSVPAPVLAPAPVSAPAPAPEAPASAEEVASEAGTVAGMRDVPLGTLIFRAGLLAEEQVEDALQEGVRTGKRLGEVLLERGWLHERDLGRLLAGQKGLPFIELGSVTPDPAAVRLLPEEKAKFQRALPIGFENGALVVAVADPSNSLVIENLRRLLNAEPRLVVAAYSELVRKIDHAYADLAAAPASQAMLDPQVAATPPVEAPAVQPVPAAVPPPVEPVAEQPAVPTVAPMPPVLSPVETRVPEEVEQLTPLVAELPAPLAQPEQTFVQEQPVVETPAAELPVVAQPEAPEPQPTTPVFEPVAAPAEAETAAPVIAPLATPAEPEVAPPLTVEPLAFPAEPQVSPEPVVEPPAAEVPTHVPEFSHVPVAEPAVEQPVVEQPVVEQPVVEQPVVGEPVAVQPVVEAPVTPEPVAEETATEESATEPSTNNFPAVTTTHFVVLRLSDGEHLEVGTFGSADEAQRFAQEVVKQIAVTEGESAWPFFAGRFLRPETIVSVDVIAESQERWMGSQIRSRWAG